MPLVDNTRRLARVSENELSLPCSEDERRELSALSGRVVPFVAVVESAYTRGSAMTCAVGDDRGVTALAFGISLFSPKWQRSSWQ